MPTGVHGLPAEHQTPEGEHEGWEATLGYLDALTKCAPPIVVAVSHEPSPPPGKRAYLLTEQIGFLSHSPHLDESSGYRSYHLNWPDREQLSGRFSIGKGLFTGTRLSTADGDDYFGLSIGLGSRGVLITDANTSMERAEETRRARFRADDRDLPDAERVQANWEKWPDHEATRFEQATAQKVRDELVKRGASLAAEKSDAELAAAWPPVWRKFLGETSSDAPKLSFDQAWVDELAIRFKVEKFELDLRAG